MDLLFSMIFGSGFAVIIAIAGIAIFLTLCRWACGFRQSPPVLT